MKHDTEVKRDEEGKRRCCRSRAILFHSFHDYTRHYYCDDANMKQHKIWVNVLHSFDFKFKTLNYVKRAEKEINQAEELRRPTSHNEFVLSTEA